MSTMQKQAVLSGARQAGVSLIELMIALVISSLITLGLIQIFGASTSTSRMTEGLSRVQESGRFASQFMQRELRMVGYMGCGSDAGRSIQESFVNHLATFPGNVVPDGNAYRFQRPIEAFTAGAMTVPTELTSITNIVDGSDVLILRVFDEESTPVLNISKATNTLTVALGNTSASFLPASGSTVLFAMQNCRSADVFAGAFNGTQIVVGGLTAPNVYADPSVTSCGSAPCPWDFRISNAFLNSTPIVGDEVLNAEIHRAEYYAFFVRTNADGFPSLWMLRFERGTTDLMAAPEELVQGVENMQLRFGVDTSADPSGDGAVDEYRTAEGVVAGATDDLILDANWRRVLSVHIGMLIRSPERAGVTGSRTYELMGVTLPATTDGAIRETYETTVALRNRQFNS